MAITTLDQLSTAMKLGYLKLYNKASITAVAGFFYSLWLTTTIPAAGAIPTTAAVCSDATLGAFPLAPKSAGQDRVIGFAGAAMGTAGNPLFIEDRLAHMGGLNGTLATAQTVNVDVSVTTSNMVERIGKSDYSQVEWYLDWYVTTGTAAVTATVAVTYHDNTTGTIAVALAASTPINRRLPILPNNGKFIKSVQTVQLSVTTGTAGNFGVTAVRVHSMLSSSVGNRTDVSDWASLPLSSIPDNACITFSTLPVTTATGTFIGWIKQGVG